MNARHTDAGRIDRDHYETSPSCGTFETAEIYGCPNAHAGEETPNDETMLRDTSTTLEVAQCR